MKLETKDLLTGDEISSKEFLKLIDFSIKLKKQNNKIHLLGHSMGGMLIQEMAKIAGEGIFKLVCYSTGAIGDIPERFETIDESREKLKKTGLEKTSHRIAKTWFVEEDRAKYFYLCSDASKATSLEAANNALIAMKNWNGLENLKNIKNQTLIVWGDQDKAYNFNQINTLNKNFFLFLSARNVVRTGLKRVVEKGSPREKLTNRSFSRKASFGYN